MDRSPNVVGEMMEPEIVVTIDVNAKNEVKQVRNTITSQIIAEGDLLLLGKPNLQRIVDFAANKSYTPEAHIVPSAEQLKGITSIADIQHSFTLLDCGRWGGTLGSGGQRGFGVVWGQWAAICEFRKADGAGPIQPDQIKDPATGLALKNNGINELIVDLTKDGFAPKIVRHTCSMTPMGTYNSAIFQPAGESGVSLNFDRVFILLPDFHLPIVRKTLPLDQVLLNGDGLPAKGRIGIKATPSGLSNFDTSVSYTSRDSDEFGVRAINRGGAIQASLWHKNYRDGDIFSGLRAEEDLVDFLRLTTAAKLDGRKRVHVVQVGDLYDLWIGLARFFDGPLSTPTVKLRDNSFEFSGASHQLTAADFINFWVDQTHKVFPSLFSAFNKIPGDQRSFFWGNHDNYFAVHTPPGIDRRRRDIRAEGVFLEHGQRGDDSNRDGAISGHQITQGVHFLKVLRSLDPNQRGRFTTAAALAFAERPDFFVYGMGHTHSPYLTKVTVKFRKVA